MPFAPLRAAGIGVLLVEYPGLRALGRLALRRERHRDAGCGLRLGERTIRASMRARIIGYGRSLGGGAIAQLAARRPLAALVLESTFTSLDDMVRAYGVPRWLVVNHFDTRAVLAKYPGPVLILHGTHDGVIPGRACPRAAQAVAAIGRCICRTAATMIARRSGSWCSVSSTQNGVCSKSDPEARHEQHQIVCVSAGSRLAASLLFTGCGLAEIGAVAATEAASAAEQAKQGKELEDKVQRDIDAAQTGRGRRARQGRGRQRRSSSYSRIPVPRFMKNTATANSTDGRRQHDGERDVRR